MEAIIIQPKSKQEMAFISEMLKRLNIKSKVLSDDEKEDLVLGNAIVLGIIGISHPHWRLSVRVYITAGTVTFVLFLNRRDIYKMFP